MSTPSGMHDNLAIPDALKPYAGRIYDADGHEYTPVNMWEEQFGSIVRPFVEANLNTKLPIANHVAADDVEIDDHSIWNTKFGRAPGAFDMERRLEVMDRTGVHRQLLFAGSVGLYGTAFYFRADEYPDLYKSITGDRKGYALKLIQAYNDFCIRTARRSDRLRVVGIALADNVEELTAEVKRMIDGGVRAVWVPAATLPGGVSPADPALNPIWDMLEASNSPILAHVGADSDFLKTNAWGKAPAFKGWKAGEEFQMDPWTLSTLHLPIQNFLTTMVFGGVFERFPRLRFGSCEGTGQWAAPLGQLLDMWHANSHKFTFGEGSEVLPIKLKPSEYIRRNCKWSLFDVEPVNDYIDQFKMPELYCYASDYPHPEGGRNPMGDLVQKLSKYDETVMRKVFCENGEWLMPN
jgi:predicted TIM-barrel fold metal-dependent hydrolase